MASGRGRARPKAAPPSASTLALAATMRMTLQQLKRMQVGTVQLRLQTHTGHMPGTCSDGPADDCVTAAIANWCPAGFGDDDVVAVAEEADIAFDVGEAGRNWERPALPKLDSRRDSIGGPACVPHACPRLLLTEWLLASQGLNLAGGKTPPRTLSRMACSCGPCCAAFQQFEVDYTMSAPNLTLYRTDLSNVPVLRMFGVTPQGAHFVSVKRSGHS